jgi:uncharacterized membrane protein
MRPDRAMWAVGLALACAVLAGLALNLLTGLTRLSWAVTLAIAVACACAGLVIYRRRSRPVAAAPVRARGSAVSPLTGGFLLLAAALAGGAVWLGAASAGWHPAPGFAQLSLVPGQGTTATLAVRDSYRGRESFRLVLTEAGHTVSTWQLTLDDGETWQRTVTGSGLTATLTTPDQTLKVTS